MDICLCEKFKSFAVAKYWFKLRGIRKHGCRGCDSGMTACVAVMDGPGGNVFHSCCSPSACGGPAWLRQQAAEPATSCLPRMMSVQALAPQQHSADSTVNFCPSGSFHWTKESSRTFEATATLPCSDACHAVVCSLFFLSLAAFIFPRTHSLPRLKRRVVT